MWCTSGIWCVSHRNRSIYLFIWLVGWFCQLRWSQSGASLPTSKDTAWCSSASSAASATKQLVQYCISQCFSFYIYLCEYRWDFLTAISLSFWNKSPLCLSTWRDQAGLKSCAEGAFAAVPQWAAFLSPPHRPLAPLRHLLFPTQCFGTCCFIHFFPSAFLLLAHEFSQAPALSVSVQRWFQTHLHSLLFWQFLPSPRSCSLSHLHLTAAALRPRIALSCLLVSGLISSYSPLAASFSPKLFSPHFLCILQVLCLSVWLRSAAPLQLQPVLHSCFCIKGYCKHPCSLLKHLGSKSTFFPLYPFYLQCQM